jgi:hypothetical protein
MDEKTIEALQTIESAMNVGNLKGAYSLADADKIISALKHISVKLTPVEPAQTPETK